MKNNVFSIISLVGGILAFIFSIFAFFRISLIISILSSVSAIVMAIIALTKKSKVAMPIIAIILSIFSIIIVTIVAIISSLIPNLGHDDIESILTSRYNEKFDIKFFAERQNSEEYSIPALYSKEKKEKLGQTLFYKVYSKKNDIEFYVVWNNKENINNLQDYYNEALARRKTLPKIYSKVNEYFKNEILSCYNIRISNRINIKDEKDLINNLSKCEGDEYPLYVDIGYTRTKNKLCFNMKANNTKQFCKDNYEKLKKLSDYVINELNDNNLCYTDEINFYFNESDYISFNCINTKEVKVYNSGSYITLDEYIK